MVCSTVIDVSTKNSLIQGLIVEEVIGKRQVQMENLRKGPEKIVSVPEVPSEV